MKNKLFKILWCISIIVAIIVFVIVGIVRKNSYDVYNSINYILLAIIEIINLLFGFLFFKKTENKIVYGFYIIFIIITLLIPIYHNGYTYAPTGPRSYLMGLALEAKYLNIYGINITKFIKLFIA